MDKTVLVSGASGFIGRPLTEKLERAGYPMVRHSEARGDVASCHLPDGAEFCRRHGASLTIMSSYVYGRPRYLPISEEHPVEAFNPYSHSKLLAEEACRYCARQFSLRVTIIRPFNIYGPGQNGNFLVPTLLRQVLDIEAQEISNCR
jgi:nucleoside-diphosphate-sugar epimerase